MYFRELSFRIALAKVMKISLTLTAFMSRFIFDLT